MVISAKQQVLQESYPDVADGAIDHPDRGQGSLPGARPEGLSL